MGEILCTVSRSDGLSSIFDTREQEEPCNSSIPPVIHKKTVTRKKCSDASPRTAGSYNCSDKACIDTSA